MEEVSKQYIILASSVVISAAAGATASYFATRHILEKQYDARFETEMAETRLYYKKFYKAEEFSKPTPIVEDEVEEAEVVEEVIVHNKYKPSDPITADEADDEEDDPGRRMVASMLRAEAEGRPYPITEEEFIENHPDHEQLAFDYYPDEDVLVNEDDQMIIRDKIDDLIGIENLDRFGYGSRHRDKLYVRNEPLEQDIEVQMARGSFAKAVHGFVEHSDDDGRPRRFRRDYE